MSAWRSMRWTTVHSARVATTRPFGGWCGAWLRRRRTTNQKRDARPHGARYSPRQRVTVISGRGGGGASSSMASSTRTLTTRAVSRATYPAAASYATYVATRAAPRAKPAVQGGARGRFRVPARGSREGGSDGLSVGGASGCPIPGGGGGKSGDDGGEVSDADDEARDKAGGGMPEANSSRPAASSWTDHEVSVTADAVDGEADGEEERSTLASIAESAVRALPRKSKMQISHGEKR
jgi:hypothetical protein